MNDFVSGANANPIEPDKVQPIAAQDRRNGGNNLASMIALDSI